MRNEAGAGVVVELLFCSSPRSGYKTVNWNQRGLGLNSGKRMVRAGITLAFLDLGDSERRDREPVAA